MLENLLKKQGLKGTEFRITLSSKEGLDFLKSIISSETSSKLDLLVKTNLILNQISEINLNVLINSAYLDENNKLIVDSDEMIKEISVELSSGEIVVLQNSQINSDYDFKIENSIVKDLEENNYLLNFDDIESEELDDIDEANKIINYVENNKLKFKEDNVDVEKKIIDKLLPKYGINKILFDYELKKETYNQLLLENIEEIQEFELENIGLILKGNKISEENKKTLLKNLYIPKLKSAHGYKNILLSESEIEDIKLSVDEIFLSLVNGEIQEINEDLELSNKNILISFILKNKLSTSIVIKLLREGRDLPLDLICDNNDLEVFSEKDVLLFINNENISYENKNKVLDSFHRNLIIEGLNVSGRVSLDNFNLLVEKTIEPDAIISDIINKNLYTLELERNEMIGLVLNKNIVSLPTIKKILNNKDLISEEINEYIEKFDWIVLDNMFDLVKLNNFKEIKGETYSILEERYFKLYGNENISLEETKIYQLQLVSKYKEILNKTSPIPELEESTNCISELMALMSFSEKYDDNKVKGYSSERELVEGLNFDSDGYEIIEKNDVQRIMTNILNKNPSGDYVSFMHEENSIELEFKIAGILKASQCPFKIRNIYFDDINFSYYLLDNLTTSGQQLKKIAERIATHHSDLNKYFYDKILNHPNCPVEAIKSIFSGIAKLAEKIIEEKSSENIYNYFIDLYNAKESENKFGFSITKQQKMELFDLFIKNENTPPNVLKYYSQIMGFDNEDVMFNVISHNNSTLDLMTEFILYNFNSAKPAHAIINKEISFEELIELSKNTLQRLEFSVNTDLPLSLINLLNYSEKIQSIVLSDEDSEFYNELKEILFVFKDLLYGKKVKELMNIATNSKNTENLNHIVNMLKNNEYFYDGLFVVKEDDVEKILKSAISNPNLSINYKSQLIEEYNIR